MCDTPWISEIYYVERWNQEILQWEILSSFTDLHRAANDYSHFVEKQMKNWKAKQGVRIRKSYEVREVPPDEILFVHQDNKGT